MAERVKIVVDSRTRVQCARGAGIPLLDGAVLAELRRAFEHANPEHERRRGLCLSVAAEPPVLRTWRDERDGEGGWLSLPRGGMRRVRAVLVGAGLAWGVEDRRSDGLEELRGKLGPCRVSLWAHQEHAVVAALARQNCLIRAPTGSGKTSAGLALIARVNLPALVVVWDANLLEQWARRCAAELGLEQVGLLRGPTRDWRLGPVTLAMQQTLAEHGAHVRARLGRTFGVVVADEVQRFAAPTLFDSIDPFAARYRVGISADETRADAKECLTYDLFGDVAADIAEGEVLAAGHVVPVRVRVVPTKFRADWYRARIRAGRVDLRDFNRLLAGMVKDEERNRLLVELVAAEARAGERTIVWTHRVEHARRLDALLARAGVMGGLLLGGEACVADFDRTRDGLAAGTLRAGVGTFQAVGQGFDVPALSRGVIATPIAGARGRQQLGQVRGRICRAVPGKVEAVLYYVWDRHVYGLSRVRNLAQWYPGMVEVLAGGGGNAWVPAPEYIRQEKQRDTGGRHNGGELEGLFACGSGAK